MPLAGVSDIFLTTVHKVKDEHVSSFCITWYISGWGWFELLMFTFLYVGKDAKISTPPVLVLKVLDL